MRHIHQDFKSKKILQFVADLIIEYNYSEFSDLSESDRHHFAALLIEAAGREGELEFLTEHAFADLLVTQFRKCLISNNHGDNETFITYAKDHAVEYYEDTMQAIFEYVHSNYQQERREWLDYAAKHGDPDAAYNQYMENLA